MLRRRTDDTFEFRDIERALYSIQPPALSAERKDALRARIMDSLGEQEALRRAGILTPDFRERWVAVPAGVGIAAAIITGIYAHRHFDGDATGEAGVTFAGTLQFDGVAIDEIRPGPTFVAASYTHVSLGDQVVVLLERGASFSYASRDGEVTVHPAGGRSTVVTGGAPTYVIGNGWSARLGVDAAAEFAVSPRAVAVTGRKGVVSVTDASGAMHALAAGQVLTITSGDSGVPGGWLPPIEPGSGEGPAQPPDGGPGTVAEANDEHGGGEAPSENPAGTQQGKPAAKASAGGSPPAVPPEVALDEQPAAAVEPEPGADARTLDEGGDYEETSGGTPPGPPEDVAPGQGGEIPGEPPVSAPAQPDGPPSDPPGLSDGSGGNGNGNGNAFGPGDNENGNGNAFGPGGNGNGNGNAFGPGGNGNGNGNAFGPGGNGNGNGGNQGQSSTGVGETGSETAAASSEPAADTGPGNGNGNGNAFGHATAPGQQENADDNAEPGGGNGLAGC